MCENIKNSDGSKKCRFIKEYSFADGKSFNKCIPNNLKINSRHINNISSSHSIDELKTQCLNTSNDNVWSEVNNTCVNIKSEDNNSKCNDINYKEVCNYKDNCYWHATSALHNKNDKLERGYCKELNTKKIENVIDEIHNLEMEKLVNTHVFNNKVNNYLNKLKNSDLSKLTIKN